MTEITPKHHKRRTLIISIVAIAVMLLLILNQLGVFVSGKIKPGRSKPGITVSATNGLREVTLTARDVPRIYKSVGTIQSQDQVEISSRIVARVTAVTVRNGDRVKKGAILVKLDDSDLTAAVMHAQSGVESAKAGIDSARERVNSAQARLDLATTNAKRNRALFKQRVIEAAKLDETEAAFRQAKADHGEAIQREKAAISDLAAIKQSLRAANAFLDHATMRAPMDGIVAERLVDPGDLASPGRILIKLFDPARLRFEVPVRESLVKAVKIGNTVPLNVPALDKSYVGKIREIVPSVDPASRTFMVMVCLGKYPELVPGMYATLSLTLGTSKALLIPQAALSRAGQLEYATIPSKTGPRQIIVRTTPVGGGMRKVLSGLEEGMTILMPAG